MNFHVKFSKATFFFPVSLTCFSLGALASEYKPLSRRIHLLPIFLFLGKPCVPILLLCTKTMSSSMRLLFEVGWLSFGPQPTVSLGVLSKLSSLEASTSLLYVILVASSTNSSLFFNSSPQNLLKLALSQS